MSEYDEKMEKLLGIKKWNDRFKEILELKKVDTIRLLEESKLNSKGKIPVLRERLLRYEAMQSQVEDVPWDSEDEVRPESDNVEEITDKVVNPDQAKEAQNIEDFILELRKVIPQNVQLEPKLQSLLNKKKVIHTDDKIAFRSFSSTREKSESDSSDDERVNEQRVIRISKIDSLKCIRLLQEWKLKFIDEYSTDSLEFIERMEDFVRSTKVSDRVLLNSLPSVLHREAAHWFRSVQDEIVNWQQFKRAFSNRFVTEMDDEDVWDEFRARRQHQDEKISVFLSKIKIIIRYFKDPPSEERQVERAYRNLLPAYRRAMATTRVKSFKDLETLGRDFERQMDLDEKYESPPLKEKSKIPSAAYEGKKKNNLIAAVNVEKKTGDNPKSEQKVSSKSDKKEKKVVAAVNTDQQNKTTDLLSELTKLLQANRAYQEQNKTINENRRDAQEDRATCFVCKKPGHRAAVCRDRKCYNCNKLGHFAAQCKERKIDRRGKRCQICKTEGVEFDYCPVCEPVRKALKNERAGE